MNLENEILKMTHLLYKTNLGETGPGLESPTLTRLQEAMLKPLTQVLEDEGDLNGAASEVLGGKFRIRCEFIPNPTTQLAKSVAHVEPVNRTRQAVTDLHLYGHCLKDKSENVNVILGEFLIVTALYTRLISV